MIVKDTMFANTFSYDLKTMFVWLNNPEFCICESFNGLNLDTDVEPQFFSFDLSRDVSIFRVELYEAELAERQKDFEEQMMD